MNDRKRRIVIIAIVALVLFGVFLGLLVANSRAQNSATQRAQEALIDSAHEQGGALGAAFDGQYQVLHSLASVISLREYEENEIAALLNAAAGASDFANIHFIKSDGTTVNGGESGGEDFADRRYFEEALSGRDALEHLTGKHTCKKCVVLAVPYFESGKTNGVLRGTLYEDDLRALLTAQVHSGRGFSFLTDSEGNAVISAESEQAFLDGGNLYDFFRNVTFLGDSSVEQLKLGLEKNQNAAIRYLYEGKARVTAVIPFRDDRLPENDWFLYDTVYEDELLSEIESGQRNSIETMSILAVFLALAVALFILLERDHTRKTREDAHLLRQSEEQFRIVAQHSGRSVFRYDIKTAAAQLDDEYVRRFGGPKTCEDFVSQSINRGSVAGESVKEYFDFFKQTAAGSSPLTADFLMRQTDGRLRWYRYISTVLFDEDGTPAVAVISYYDCTASRERELAYARWQRELESTSYDNAALYEWNLSKDVPEGYRGALVAEYEGEAANSFNARTGYYAQTRVCEDDKTSFISMMNRERLIGIFYDGGYSDTMDFRFVTDDGTLRWHRITVQMVQYPGTQDIKVYVTNEDIDDKKKKELALIARSEQDSLTGVLNRATFVKRMNAMIAASPKLKHAVLMLDADGFKQINDTLGHDAGDKALINLVMTVRSSLRAGDLVGRIGGDEFIVFLSDMPFDDAVEKKARQLCNALRQTLAERISMSVSIGIAMYPRDGKCFEMLYKKADMALYCAKDSGKDTYIFYKEGMTDGLQNGETSDERSVEIETLRGAADKS